MAGNVKKSMAEIPTIDVNLVTIEVDDKEFGFDTANQISVEPQTEETDAIRLVIKGKLKAQKPQQSTLTGNQITLTDNVFNPELVQVLQGGAIYYSEDGKTITGYEPPAAGSDDKGQVFTLNCYSAQYDASGIIQRYEKISYPNCQGIPVAFSAEDDTFRAPEYTINSAPAEGEPPYKIAYVEQLPTLEEPDFPEPGLTMTAEIVNSKDAFVLNDNIQVKVSVKNTGATAFTDVVVTCDDASIVDHTSVQNVTYDEASHAWTINGLNQGATRDLTVERKVTEQDIAAGTNSIKIGFSADECEATATVAPTLEPMKKSVKLVKKVTNQPAAGIEQGYASGETIKYQVTATNDGNQTLTNVKLTDSLVSTKYEHVTATQMPVGVVYDGASAHDFTIATWEPGKEFVIPYDYEVQEGDAAETPLKNKMSCANPVAESEEISTTIKAAD